MASKKATTAESVTVAAKKLGKLGGQKGGPARARVLTVGERSRIAAMGAKAKAAKAKRKGG